MLIDRHSTISKICEASESSTLDVAALLERVGGDNELLQEIIGLFFEEYPRLVEEIRTFIENRDARSLERSAHTLKGSVSNFGAQPATQAAHNLELIGRHSDFHLAEGAVETLQSELSAVHSALAQLQLAHLRG